jgi:hypothetical protein
MKQTEISQPSQNPFSGSISRSSYVGTRPGQNPKKWGPPWWELLEGMRRCKRFVGETAQRFITTLSKLLTCSACRRNFQYYISKHPLTTKYLSSSKAMAEWLCKAKNDVSRRNNKSMVPCTQDAICFRAKDPACLGDQTDLEEQIHLEGKWACVMFKALYYLLDHYTSEEWELYHNLIWYLCEAMQSTSTQLDDLAKTIKRTLLKKQWSSHRSVLRKWWILEAQFRATYAEHYRISHVAKPFEQRIAEVQRAHVN